MRKIKVLHISPDSKIHGTERHILSILKHADREVFENSVVIPDEGEFNKELDKINIRVFKAGRKHGYKSKMEGIFGKGVRDLYNLIKKEKFDIVHSHLNSYGGFIAKLARASAIVHTRHGVFWSEEELQNISFAAKFFQKMKSKIFDKTIALGQYEKKTLVEKFNYDEEKIATTLNGVDVEEINSKVDRKSSKQNLFGTDDIIIGTAGRLEKQKGLGYFLEAVKSIKDKTEGLTFVIIGDGSLKEDLKRKRNEAGLEDKIIFMDYKNNILDYVNGFDVMIQTSLWEGLSYAVQEAMALSKPVIALTSPNVSGVKEIIVNGETGYLIESDYVNELANRILILSKDPVKRLEFGKASKEREENFFPEWKTAADMETIYRDLYNSKVRTK